MKYTASFLVLLLCIAGSIYSQTRVEIPVIFRTPTSTAFTLTVGVDSRATDCVDTALDEFDLPPPPPSFSPIILPGCTDTNSGTTITLRRDYRPIPSTEFCYTHNIRLIRNSDRGDVIISWDNTLPPNIDSAVLQIEFLDTINMASQNQFIITNEFISTLQLKVCYSFPSVDVQEQKAVQPEFFPHPVEETLTLSAGEYSGGIYELYTGDGRLVQAGSISEQQILLNMSRFPAGVYLLHRKTSAGKSDFRHFIKQ